MKKILPFKEFNEDAIIVGFGPDYTRSYSLSTSVPVTGYSLKPVVGYIKEMCNLITDEASAYEGSDNPDQTAEGYIKEVKNHINKSIDEVYEANYANTNDKRITEAEDYKFDPAEAEKRLKKREESNIRRFRAAQDRNDNYATELYQLKIKIDKVDREKLKIQKAIFDLKKQFGKDE